MADDRGPSGLSEVAALLADAARSRMLMAMMGGQALTATELAEEAGVAPSTASGHLARLVEGGLVAVEPRGRHRYFRLARREVAELLEGLAGFGAARGPARRFGPPDPALRAARVCYDHLAGERAVRLFDRLRERGLFAGDDGCSLSRDGVAFFERFGLDLEALRASRRAFARPCLDWSERRHHLGGALGAALLARILELGWAERALVGRSVTITARGEKGLSALLGEAAPLRFALPRR